MTTSTENPTVATTVSSVSELTNSNNSTVPVVTGTEEVINTKSNFDSALAELLDKAPEHQNFENEIIDCSIHPAFVEVKTTLGTKKQISHSDFKKILLNLKNSENSPEEIKLAGVLPPSNMFFISIESKKISLSCYYTSAVKNMQYTNDGRAPKKFDIITPNIIISHILTMDNAKDWVITSTKYFCTDLPVNKLPRTFISAVDNRNRIFLLPMSNTYDDGKMCYGNNSMPVRYKENNLRGLDYYYSYLWETPFNSDLGIKATGSSYVDDWYSLLKKRAEDKEAFPYSRLRGWSEGEYSNSNSN